MKVIIGLYFVTVGLGCLFYSCPLFGEYPKNGQFFYGASGVASITLGMVVLFNWKI